MKKILGLDLGTASIGWALVNEAETKEESSSITKLGVRIIHYDTFTNGEGQEIKGSAADEFCKGKSVSPNAARTKCRSMRRTLQRYKLRRKVLIELLTREGWISENAILNEHGNHTTFETLRLRSLAATEKVTLLEFARILLNINKKRGYKSSRKAKGKEEGSIVDGLSLAKELYEEGITPGEFVYRRMLTGKYQVPDFYRSDLKGELDRIWETQHQFYPEILSKELKDSLNGKSKGQIFKICQAPFSIVGIKREFKGKELKTENYKWRSEAVHQKIGLEQLAVVLQEVCDHIKNSSGYLGGISDRSKELFFANLTVGQWQWKQIESNPHHSLKNQVFFRQDYMDEFERIWETQANHHKELTDELKKEIRDIIIFYQRPLRSQKGLVSLCEFEHWTKEVIIEGKTKQKTFGLKVCPKSSPLFQEFKIWQILNNIKVNGNYLEQEEKEALFAELNIKGKLSGTECLKILYKKRTKGLEINYKNIEGNNTQASLFEAYSKILEISGHECDLSKMSGPDALEHVRNIFEHLGYKTDYLYFDSSLDGSDFECQPSYRLWHLLYSFEGDKSISGNESLVNKIAEITGMDNDAAKILATVTFAPDYGNLSTKAMRKILPYMRAGNEYSLACEYAGYRHSAKSLTREELAEKSYKDKLDSIPKNSLRNPVVEKILNQMVNVVNEIIATYGKPDGIRIEMARELKKSAKERHEMSEAIGKASAAHESIRELLIKEFNIPNPSRNDIIRYKLYRELEKNGYKTLYSGTYIPQEKLFSKEFDIEHIIPQAKLFDDSFSNKTLEARQVNIDKSNSTALDFVTLKYGDEYAENYIATVENLCEIGSITKAKRNKLLMKESEIPQGFIERDLRETQYIAKLAKNMLEEVVKDVVSTSGAITDRLREDWQLVDVMKEINWAKYEKLGMTEITTDKDGRRIYKIKDWTKRNDHRHHAVDALAIAFTKRCYIQYLNNLNARIPKGLDDTEYIDLSEYELYDLPVEERSAVVRYIESNMMYRDNRHKLRFCPPMPLEKFRQEAKRQIENILISIKAKGKVVTRNVNKTKKRDGSGQKVQLTPRGQLHNDTVYGKITHKGTTIYTKREAISPSLKIDKIIDEGIRRILKARLTEYNGDAQKAFSNLDQHPIWLNEEKGIAIKRVTITGKSTVVPLHNKRDNSGNFMVDDNGNPIPTDYVSTGSNHHIAIFKDADGNLQEQVVSFFDAVTRVNLGMPVIDYGYRHQDGWTFLFTMKQNEYFVFPNPETGFDPNEIDLMDPNNYAMISPNLFRVQKMTTRDYFFRHHLETTVSNSSENLRNITWIRIRNANGLNGIVKVRINHIGEIVKVGE
ncbi:MAG: type II CRISPR RNA-guided endonuclease Cas9 [Bacteroidales bacterium]|nr:type II CRISPR RNA-guided endonuclease Cas9 [Bacteroidales bacterium]